MCRKLLILMVVVLLGLVGITGCGSEAAVGGAGAAGGFLASETFKGMEADLEKREAELVAAWNAGQEQGMEAEKLADIEKELDRVRTGKSTVKVAKKFLGIDWSNPEDIGVTGGPLVALIVYGLLKRKKFGEILTDLETVSSKYDAHKAGTQKFMKTATPEDATKLFNEIGDARRVLKVP